MKKLILTAIISISFLQLWPQQTEHVSLEECQQSALVNYPNFKQTELNNSIYELNVKNTKSNYYPTLNLNGQISYQSDVTKMPIPPIQGFVNPELSKDWYKLNLNVQQIIYDGGVTSGKKAVTEADMEISNQQVQIELYQIKEKVNHLFFNIIFLKKNIEILNVLLQSINASLKDAESAFNNGTILKSEVDKLKVEMIYITQQIIEKQADITALLAALNELTKLKITSAEAMITPELTINNYNYINNRPEYLLFTKQQHKIDVTKTLTTSKRRPVFSAFGQAGYGRPGYDMLNNDFDDYYMIGARLHWNIWDWNKVNNEKQILNIQNEIIISKKQSFDQGLRVDLFQRIENMSKYKKLLETDDEIIELQDNIVKTSLIQFNNGTITSTTYLIELNKLSKAKLNMEAHKLYLIFAKYQYITAIGKL
ncbi:MAG: TolC family protein [Bacteroidetes bacterium]|nr:TolC family protein [Bacteroidota bacterium]MBL6943198.1 TolC family protein [Bacteroidales bacterium]